MNNKKKIKKRRKEERGGFEGFEDGKDKERDD